MRFRCKLLVLSLASLIWLQIAHGQEKPEPGGQASPAAASTGTRPPTVGVKESKEHLLKRVNASYPPIAKAAHVGGTVVIGAEINTSGDVTQVVTLSGPEMLRSAAIDAVKQYKYRPFLVDGVPSIVRTAVQVTFLAPPP